jgi:hypothetical protein
MRYLKKENPASYEELVKKLKIKPARVITKPDGTKVELEEDMGDDMDIMAQGHESANS